jgi:DnaJ-class molecular chaperone
MASAMQIRHRELAKRLRADGRACKAGYGDACNGCPEITMSNEKGPNIKKKQKCKNCEGKGLLKKGDRVLKCQRCKGTGVR